MGEEKKGERSDVMEVDKRRETGEAASPSVLFPVCFDGGWRGVCVCGVFVCGGEQI